VFPQHLRVVQRSYPDFRPPVPQKVYPDVTQPTNRAEMQQTALFYRHQSGRTVRDETEPNLIVDYDETLAYKEMRVVTASECSWLLFEYPLHKSMHKVCTYLIPVMRFKMTIPLKVVLLVVHEEDDQLVHIRGNDLRAAAQREPRGTTLTAFFEANADPAMRSGKTKYEEFPKKYVWIDATQKWQIRKKLLKPTIGRLVEISPSRGDLFYMRQLLKHVTGKRSFEDLRTVNGYLHKTYKAAALALGLLRDDEEYHR
jgi:hypothetical protein